MRVMQYNTPRLQDTAIHCNTLQHTATHYNTQCHIYLGVSDHTLLSALQWKIPMHHCNALQHTAMTATYCNKHEHTATHCNTLQHLPLSTRSHSLVCSTRANLHAPLQHTATHGNTLQHPATPCNTLQHSATLYNTLQPSAAYCNIF